MGSRVHQLRIITDEKTAARWTRIVSEEEPDRYELERMLEVDWRWQKLVARSEGNESSKEELLKMGVQLTPLIAPRVRIATINVRCLRGVGRKEQVADSLAANQVDVAAIQDTLPADTSRTSWQTVARFKQPPRWTGQIMDAEWQ